MFQEEALLATWKLFYTATYGVRILTIVGAGIPRPLGRTVQQPTISFNLLMGLSAGIPVSSGAWDRQPTYGLVVDGIECWDTGHSGALDGASQPSVGY